MNGCAVQTEKVISHILEIIYLMTGEEYMIVKKPSQYKCSPQALEDPCESKKSVLEIPVDSPVHVRKRRCHPASWDTNGMPRKAQEFPDSTFEPPRAHVQIKCDDVAMYLSLEEWEYLEHHKEEYGAMIGKNQSSLDAPEGQCAPEGFLSQLNSEQRDFSSNSTMEKTNTRDWNAENEFTAPTICSITACENKSSPNRESSDKIYRRRNASGTGDSGGEVFPLQNNLTLHHEALSEIFLETEIKEECMMQDCEDRGVRSKKHNHMDSPSVMDGHQLKTANALDSSVESNYFLDLILPPFSENPQHTSLINGHQNKMAEFTDSGLLDGHTLDHIQSPFGEVLQRKGIKKGLRCSTVGQETKAVEVGDFSLKTNRSLSITNVFKDMPQTTPTRTGLQDKESSTDGHQAKDVAINNCPLVNEEAESISNIFRNVYEKDHIKIYQVHSLDETMKVEIDGSSVEDCEALYQPSSSLTDRPQRTCIKTELICQELSKNGHQKNTMDETNSPLVESPILGRDTRSCIKKELIGQEHFKNGHQTNTTDKINSRLVESYILGADTSTLKYGLHKLAYQECLMHGQQPNAVEVNHSTPEYPYSPHTDWQANNKHLSSSSKTSSSQSTGRVQSRRKPTKMISCSECGKIFSSNSYLLRHQRLHTGEKPFTCSECGKSFSWMSSLVTHKRTHLGEKPFSCKQCGKKFSDYSGIIKHRRSHTGEKPYSCLVCGERFAQTYQLVKHQAVHLAEDVPKKPFNGW